MYNFFIPITLALLFVTSLFFAISGKLNIILFAILALAAGVAFFLFRRVQLSIFFKHHSELDVTEGRINMLKESVEEKEKILEELPIKRKNLSSLFKASQDLIELIEKEDIFNFLIEALEKLFLKADSIFFFEFNKEKDQLELVRSLNKENSLTKDKKGNMLDKWVLRHNSSLLVEDISNDYRFDCSRISAYKERGVKSFIVSPLSIEYRLMGVVRLESQNTMNFSLDDLRFLRNICDLAAVVIERSNLFAAAQNLAIRDPLTSLFVKDYFYERLSQEYRRATVKKSSFGLLMIDIDDFKKINDTYGHVIGDHVLSKLSGILKKICGGSGNVIARFGGEEFIALVVVTTKDELHSIAEKIRSVVELSDVVFRRKKLKFTISMGVVFFPEEEKDIMMLVDTADKRLYKAKNKGKNRVCYSG